jgi:hypothetical protein
MVNTVSGGINFMKLPIEFSFDWKEGPGHVIDELAPVLRSVGIFVYENPLWSGGDSVSIILSKKKLTRNTMVQYLLNHHRDYVDDMKDEKPKSDVDYIDFFKELVPRNPQPLT